MVGDDESDAIHGLVRQVREIVASKHDAAALDALHDAAAAVSPLSAADVLVRAVGDLDSEPLRETGRWLAEHGTRRGAVAIGVVLLGVAGDTRDRSLLLLLGALEGLTLYATVALLRSQPDRDRAIFDLARRVRGWGRIHAVERLAGTQDPEIKAWLLREGFRNAIVYEYLAYIAATAGDLADALASSDPVDDELLDGAGSILIALCGGGPGKDMTDYADGPVAFDRFLTQVGRRPPTLRIIGHVATLADCLKDLAWDDALRADLSARSIGLTNRADWRLLLTEALDCDDLETFRAAIWPASLLRVPLHDRVRRHLSGAPYDTDLWWPLVHRCDSPEDLDKVVCLAMELLPLDDLATGPGPGSIFRTPAATVLSWVVERLDERPGTGWPLIRAALSNETVRSRYAALFALKAWPTLPDEVAAVLREAIAVEPDGELRAEMREVLRVAHDAGPGADS